MSGAFEPQYVAARQALLDALDALQSHLSSFVLVGAQAIYIHTGDSGFALAPYTVDADVAVSPELIADEPLIEGALTEAGFELKVKPGIWASSAGATFDLLVPESLAGRGSRGADLGAHGRYVARRARGLEAAIVENSIVTIEALGGGDQRKFELAVAGPAALTVAKVIKISERLASDRLVDKDALDVLRLFRAVPLDALAGGFELLRSDTLSEAVATETVERLPELFGDVDAQGVMMAMRAVRGVEDEAEIGRSLVALAGDLHSALS